MVTVQRHEVMNNTSPHMPAMRTAGNSSSSDSETSLTQKLMSAVVGSVLTSLVGEFLFLEFASFLPSFLLTLLPS